MANPKKVSNVPGKKNWKARGPVPDRRVKFFETKSEAQDWLDGLRKARREGTYIPAKSIPLFGEMTAQFVASKQAGYTPNMIAFTVAQCGHLASLADYRLNTINVDVVERFRDQLKDGGKLSSGTVNRVLTTGAGVFNLAMRRGYAVSNPFELAERLRVGSSELIDGEDRGRDANHEVREGEYLAPPEIRRLLDSARPGFDHTLILTAALTGARIGELLALRWTDVELDSRKIYIRRSLSWTAAAENTPARAAFYPPKTKAGERPIPIPAELATALKRWKLAGPSGELNLVFPGLSGLPVHHSVVLRGALYPALRRAGLRQVGFHSLRHSYATTLITAGTPVNQVSALLGHANSAITLAVYTHHFRNSDDAVIDRVFGSSGHLLDTQTEKTPQSA
ncbi:MAG TPA: tyrosine-type recombinase/integrase [Candidatus Binatus sp.]|uniref:tyrosine-type recombinase/integrase n=1 Tax=Candidatus Binatus sp. TaxID=2811406 RepID=UPI002B4702AF|nr:tyrosine-type recombinase/integrase [Candidatus Binatus sp.]HKN13413.1 tyrosine-type recombinase/integrase [Candidatus Binatus sp.]